MDKAVKGGIVQPGQYLILQFDFSRVARPRDMDEFTESLKGEINRGLREFKFEYAVHLGQSFESATSGFIPNDAVGNLTDLIGAVDLVLQDIHDGHKKDNPLWGVRGVCLF